MKRTLTINWAWIGVYILLAAILSLNVYGTYYRDQGEQRSITVEGTATIDAEPDSFVFYPQFQIASSDPDNVKEELAAKGKEVVDKLKALGLTDKDIKLDASQYDNYYGVDMPKIDGQQTVVSLTVTVADKTLAQKVQDYLGTTDATGQLTPQASFSEAQQKVLSRQAEEKAITDARERADTLAKNLDARRGKVISVTNLSDNSLIYSGREKQLDIAESSTSLPVQPGTNEFTYRVSVKFVLQ